MSAVLQEPIEQAEAPTTQTIVLPVSESLMAGVKPVGAVAEAKIWEVDNPAMAQLAADQRKAWAKRADQIAEMGEGFVAPARDALKRVRDNFNKWLKPAIDDLNGGREILGQKLLAFDQAEKARLEHEKAEREALARRLRQEAEAKAAAERARAEEQAREASRKEQEAREAHAKALADGNARQAAALAAEAAKQAEKAAAAVENGEARAQAVQLEAAAQVQAAPVAAVVKIAGQSTKIAWIAELKPGITIDQAKDMIVLARAGVEIIDGKPVFDAAKMRPDLLALLDLDTAARGSLNKLASAQQKVMSVPGFIAKEVQSIAGSRK